MKKLSLAERGRLGGLKRIQTKGLVLTENLPAKRLNDIGPRKKLKITPAKYQ